MQISCVITDTLPRPHASSTWSISAIHATDKYASRFQRASRLAPKKHLPKKHNGLSTPLIHSLATERSHKENHVPQLTVLFRKWQDHFCHLIDHVPKDCQFYGLKISSAVQHGYEEALLLRNAMNPSQSKDFPELSSATTRTDSPGCPPHS